MTAGLIAAVAYVGSVATNSEMLTVLFAVMLFAALAGYVLLSPEGNPARVRLPLLAGVLLLAVLVIGETVWILNPQDFGWFSYGPSDQVDEMLRQMAERSLSWLSFAGSAMLAGFTCFLVAVRALPRKRSKVLAVVAGALAVLALGAAVLSLSNMDSRLAVWIAALGLIVILAVAWVAGQRANLPWLIVAGATLLAWRSLELLEGAVSSALLAEPRGERVLIRAFSVMPQGFDAEAVLLPAATVAGVLLIVLGCLPLRRTTTSISSL